MGLHLHQHSSIFLCDSLHLSTLLDVLALQFLLEIDDILYNHAITPYQAKVIKDKMMMSYLIDGERLDTEFDDQSCYLCKSSLSMLAEIMGMGFCPLPFFFGKCETCHGKGFIHRSGDEVECPNSPISGRNNCSCADMCGPGRCVGWILGLMESFNNWFT